VISRIFKILKLIKKANLIKKYYFLIFLMLVYTIFELLSLGSIISLIVFLKDPNLISNFIEKYSDNHFFSWLNLNQLNASPSIIIINLFIFLYFLKLLFVYFYIYFSQTFNIEFENKLNFITLQKYYEKYFDLFQKRSSNLFTSFSNRIPKLSLTPLYLSIIFVESLIVIIIFFILILNSSLTILIAIILFIVFSLTVYLFSSSKIKQHSYERGKFVNSSIEHLKEFFDGLREILVYKSGTIFVNKYSSLNIKSLIPQKKIGILNSYPRIILESIFILVIMFSIIILSKNMKTLDDFFFELGAFFILLLRTIPSINKIMFHTNNFKYSYEPIDIIYNDLSSEAPNNKEIKYNFDDKISIENINFKYDDDNSIFKKFSLDIKKNEKILILGKSGSGKSTLIDLIIGILKLDDGDIKVDKLSTKINPQNWMDLISYVPQNSYLQNYSVKFNITFQEDEKEIDEKLLQKSLNISGLNEEIENKKIDINQIIETKSKNISGGQKQRISLARAIYKKSPIIILDEATNSLDEKSENEIIRRLNELNDTTLIVISHNSNLIKFFEKSYKLENSNLNILKL